jgi:histidyl-tRNA synthetase
MQYKTKPAHISKQFTLAERGAVPIGVIVGEEEIAANCVRIKQLGLGMKSDGEKVERGKLVESVRALLKALES